MRTIHTRGTVTEDRKLTIDVPSDVAPGEHQVVVVIDDISGSDLAAIAQGGGAFDWLKDEPDLYSDDDGEPIGKPRAANADLLSELGLVAVPWRAWPQDSTFSRDDIYTDDGR
jgi:hypothetical protein